MQVKCFFLTLTVLFSFLPLGFAQGDRPIVQVIYFRPSDIPSPPDVDAEIDALIKRAQRFYADEMERHGFGRKTFQMETDADGNTIVHHVDGKFTHAYYPKNLFSWVDETHEQINVIQGNIRVYMIGSEEGKGNGFTAGGHGGSSRAHIYSWHWATIAHELGHAFGLPHDDRNHVNIMYYTAPPNQLSKCAAEWLEVHSAFNPGNSIITSEPWMVIAKLTAFSLDSPPNTIRLRFEVTDPDGIHQVQFLIPEPWRTSLRLIACKRLNGNISSTVEFVTTQLPPKTKRVGLRFIDVHGNFSVREFQIDITSLLPPSEVISMPDSNLAAKVRNTLGLTPDEPLTTHAILNLTSLYIQESDGMINDLTGLEHAHSLAELHLDGNGTSDISPLTGLTRLTRLELHRNGTTDISPLAGLTQLTGLALFGNHITDISPLAGLTQLTELDLHGNEITDISPLTGLTQLTDLSLRSNGITDISPLTGLTQLTRLELRSNGITDISPLTGLTRLSYLFLRDNDISDVSPLLTLNLIGFTKHPGLYLEGNPLSFASINTHIPALQAKGIKVVFDNIAHPALMKISGDLQEGTAGKTISPFIVEAQDKLGLPMYNVPVTFTLYEGDGMLVPTTTTTDVNGSAHTTLALGWTPGTYIVRADAEGIRGFMQFRAIATTPIDYLAEDANGDGVVDVEDLLLVAASFGTPPAPGVMPNTDVNGDGVINNEDMLLVLAALEAAPAAPTLDTQWTVTSLQRWIAEAKQRNSVDAVWLKGISVLEQWLSDLLPKETVLLHNYPNPFNPETWIPYQLAAPAEVTLTIYAVNGQVVRTLALGHQPAGMYHSRSRAAYWDGQNEHGERVASGVYFYTLTAGGFAATRKIVIRK